MPSLPDWFGQDDPWLTHRMIRMQEIEHAEDIIGRAVQQAMAAFLDLARAGVLGENTPPVPAITAAGPEESEQPPDLSGWPTAAEWDAFVSEYVIPQVSVVFGEAFAAEVRRGVLGDGPYRLAYLEEVHDRLKIWPQGAFTEVRYELLEGLDSGESIPQLRDRIGRVLNIDARSRDFQARARALEKIIDDPSATASAKARARQQRAALFEEMDAENFRWWWKAERIARTEAIGALNGGTFAGAQAWSDVSGEQMFKQWWATSDNRTRPSHWQAHMDIVPLGEMFTVGGFQLKNPGDPNGPGHEVINCRCSLLILDAEEVQQERPRVEAFKAEQQARMQQEQEGALVASAAAERNPAMTAPDRMPTGWRGRLAPLEIRSSDDRLLKAPQQLDTRPLPLPMLVQEHLAPGHDGAMQGLMNITEAWIEDWEGQPYVWGRGDFDMDDPRALDVIRKIAGGFLRFVSVDLDHTMAELRCYRGDLEVDCDDVPAEEPVDVIDYAAGHNPWRRFGLGTGRALTASAFDELVMPVEVALEWRLMGATLVPHPAFPEAYIELEYADAPAREPEISDPSPGDREPFAVSGSDDLELASRDHPWDGDAAAQRVAAWADGDAEEMGRAYFYRDPEADPATQAAYKLGYADVIDGVLTAVPRGIFAVAGVLEGAMGGVDIPESDASAIRAKVSGWYARMAEEFEDPSIVAPWDAPERAAMAAVPEANQGGFALKAPLEPIRRGAVRWPQTLPEIVAAAQKGAQVLMDSATAQMAKGGIIARTGGWMAGPSGYAEGVDLGALPILFRPPAAWFVKPDFSGPTPLTITDDGRVFGHLGLYEGSDSCHVGFRGRCVPPPRGTSFERINNKGGSLRVAEGYDIACGKLFAGGPHASTHPSVTASEAEDHYANTSDQIARGRFYEDQWGQLFAGALMPGVTPVQVETVRSSTMSGDWREIDGHPFLVACLIVNMGGFSVPRVTTGDDGRILAMTAAGAIIPCPGTAEAPPPAAGTVSVVQMSPEAFARESLAQIRVQQRRQAAAGAMLARLRRPHADALAGRVLNQQQGG